MAADQAKVFDAAKDGAIRPQAGKGGLSKQFNEENTPTTWGVKAWIAWPGR